MQPGGIERDMVEHESLKTKVFADGADLRSITDLARDSSIAGFTTNPTLMRNAGLTDYQAFARQVLDVVTDKPVSFEVCADEGDEILRQARTIASWGDNVYVKVPVTTCAGEPLADVARQLSEDGVKVNVTALFTVAQVEKVAHAIGDGAPAYLSVFAGRIADAGIDPMPIVAQAVAMANSIPNAEVIWASPREVLNLVQANGVGCHIITMTPDLLKKRASLGKDLEQFSLETVQMFRNDALTAGLSIPF